MAVLSTATASGRVFFSANITTTSLTMYTAPPLNSNVTAPSATAYIKEIIVANTNAASANVTITANGVSILPTITIGANDSKILSGLNCMLTANATVIGYASTTGIQALISGVEIQ